MSKIAFQNLVQGKLVNGSIGRVTGFSTYKEALAGRINIPGADENQNNFMSHLLKESEQVWPLVHFTNDEKILCVLADFTVNNAEGEMEARRSQVGITVICYLHPQLMLLDFDRSLSYLHGLLVYTSLKVKHWKGSE
jgi:hypothetical protein